MDDKGRVAIPAGLRAILQQNSTDSSVVIAPHDSGKRLVGFDTGWQSLLRDQINEYDRLERANGRAYDKEHAARVFGSMETIPYDPSGRMIIPPRLRERGKIKDLAFFFGAMDTFQIWSPEVLLADPDADAFMVEDCRWHMANRKQKG